MIEIYPDRKIFYKKLENLLKILIKQVVHILRQRSSGVVSKEPSIKKIINDVAMKFADHIYNQERKINVYNNDIISSIKDFMKDPKHANLYVNILSKLN
jgi:hypothetical protein